MNSLALRVNLTGPQREFMASRSPYTMFIAGRGSGKTTAATWRGLSLPPGSELIYVAPTYVVLRDVTKRSFYSVHDAMLRQTGKQLIVEDRKADNEMTLLDGKRLKFRSADNWEKLRGLNIEYLFIDEAAIICQDCWDILAAALRVGAQRLWITTTPKGRNNWVYKMTQLPSDQVKVIRAPTMSNPYLPSTWADMLRRQYTNSFARQELDGEFVDYASLTKPEWYRRIPADDIPDGFTCMAIDPAYGLHEEADYTAIVIVTFNDGIYYVRDVIRQHLTIQQIVETVRSIMGIRRIDCVCVEDCGFRQAVLQSLTGAGIYAYGVKPVKDKITRFLPTLDKFERGCIMTSDAVGDYFADELFSFPGDHDDMVDALVYAIMQIEIMNGSEIEVVARRKGGRNA